MTQGKPLKAPSIIGVCPVVETPFFESGESDPGALALLIDRLAHAGVTAVMYAGLASEMDKLAGRERDRLTELVIDRGHRNGMTVVASVSDAQARVAAGRGERYVARGADIINVYPALTTPMEPRAVLAHVAAVLSAIAPTPGILQLVPAHVAAGVDAAAIARLSDASPNLVQVKVESRPPGRFITELRELAPRLTCLVGSGGVDLPDAVRTGAVGVQPGCSAVELYLQYWRLWSRGDIRAADLLHRRMRPYLSYWMQDVDLIVAAEKRTSFLRGWIPNDVCRDPARVLSDDEVGMVERFLEEFRTELLEADHHSANEPSG
jgi:dihydrodipicolinate synthase/N-acetylneuraminate lyase